MPPVEPKEYRVPAGYGEALLVEKKSRFIARVWHVADEAEALSRIAETRSRHRDATHNVFAYSIRNGQTRYSDDGEPQGTSGMPTLNVFQNEAVENVCCVVTRYYGGILLGAGGLVRAYSKAAKAALDEAGIILMRQWDVLRLACPYPQFERLKSVIAAHEGVVGSTEFGADVLVRALIPSCRGAAFSRAVLDMSSGAVEPILVETVFRGARLR